MSLVELAQAKHVLSVASIKTPSTGGGTTVMGPNPHHRNIRTTGQNLFGTL
jgi:hypothetical protein